MRETRSEPPQPRTGRALAHAPGASGPEPPHRSRGRTPHTPRGSRSAGPAGRRGTLPPVPRRPAFFRLFPALGPLLVLAVLTWQVAAYGPLRRADERLGGALAGRGPSWLTQLLADLGNVPVALPVLLAAAAYAVWRARSPGPAIRAGLVMAAVPAVVVPMKWALARPGPLTDATGYYPSGHAATAAVAYCGAGLLLVPYVRHRYRTLPLVAAVLLTAANGAGLVLHGYHWPLDVAASWCLSALLLRGVLVRRSSRPAHPTSDYVSDMTQGPHN